MGSRERGAGGREGEQRPAREIAEHLEAQESCPACEEAGRRLGGGWEEAVGGEEPSAASPGPTGPALPPRPSGPGRRTQKRRQSTAAIRLH